MANEPRPTYFATQHKTIPNRFNVYEMRGRLTEFLFEISPKGIDLFQELLKRGIPVDSAKNLFYSMTT